ncbi:hypothetical protein HA38_14070 [Pantoea allii]|nr:hypothetical protein A6A26_10315 [Pantoea sp. OXWO6B1]ORM84797.1 hypothetical protein HA38_14070 [Pantoea allii]PBJ98739.1 hypothetical protein CMR03_18750 [Pantoea allii]
MFVSPAQKREARVHKKDDKNIAIFCTIRIEVVVILQRTYLIRANKPRMSHASQTLMYSKEK